MKHSSLAIWLGLGVAFMGLLTTFVSVWAARRKKATDALTQPTASQPEQKLRDGPTRPN